MILKTITPCTAMQEAIVRRNYSSSVTSFWSSLGLATPKLQRLLAFTRLRKSATGTSFRCSACAAVTKNFACGACNSVRCLLAVHRYYLLVITIYGMFISYMHRNYTIYGKQCQPIKIKGRLKNGKFYTRRKKTTTHEH